MTAIRTGETTPAPPEVLLRSPWFIDYRTQHHSIAEQRALVEDDDDDDDAVAADDDNDDVGQDEDGNMEESRFGIAKLRNKRIVDAINDYDAVVLGSRSGTANIRQTYNTLHKTRSSADDDHNDDEEDDNEFKTNGTSNDLDGYACEDDDDVIDSEDSHEEADGTARASAKRRKVSYKSSLLPVFAVSLYFIFL
jgi:hypothetical protein